MRVTALSAVKHDGVDYLDGQSFDINDEAGQILVDAKVVTPEGSAPVAAQTTQTAGDPVVDPEKLPAAPAQPGQPTAVTVRKG